MPQVVLAFALLDVITLVQVVLVVVEVVTDVVVVDLVAVAAALEHVRAVRVNVQANAWMIVQVALVAAGEAAQVDVLTVVDLVAVETVMMFVTKDVFRGVH